MYLRRIVLENIRGFSQLDFTLQRPDDTYAGWTVILGDNASGKTALLKSIAIALVGPDTARTLQPSVTGWIRSGARVGTIATQLLAGADDRFAQGRRYEKPFWSEIQLKCDDHEKVSLSQGTKYRRGTGPTRGPWAENPEGWFCVGYGPFRRLYGHSPEAQRLMSTKGKVARFATMFREDATLAECDIWLRQLRYRALEGDGHAQSVLERVLQILNHDFMQHHMVVDRVDSDGLWLTHQDGVTLSLGDMSDGYRAALAMLVDILKQLVEVYGLNGFTISNSSEPQVTYSGVVLIDEIDVHLHPSWQRAIGEWFKRILPNMQFVVTTHSPFICQAADASGLFHLPAPGTHEEPFQLTKEDYVRVISGKPDTIYLTPAFNMEHTRSPQAVRARKEYSLLQSKKSSRKLTPEETRWEEQLSLFVSTD